MFTAFYYTLVIFNALYILYRFPGNTFKGWDYILIISVHACACYVYNFKIYNEYVEVSRYE